MRPSFKSKKKLEILPIEAAVLLKPYVTEELMQFHYIPHGQPFSLSHYTHFSTANRKIRSSTQIPHCKLFEMSRSMPRSPATGLPPLVQ
ncbi:hypothetical protein TNCV_1955301 [Trichonephila clavipes]|nr:hypothetical protein TNCV_1955301 [Trichonephila clavipes]